MAPTVRDAAILLGWLCGADPNEAVTREGVGQMQADYTKFLDETGLKGAKIGVWRDRFGFHERVDEVLNESIAAMKAAGAEIIDPTNIASVGQEMNEAEYEVLLYEFKTGLNHYLAGRGSDTRFRTLEALIEFNESNAEAEMPYFGQDVFFKSQEKGSLTDKPYLDALETRRRLSRTDGIDKVQGEHNLDAIIAPTGLDH